ITKANSSTIASFITMSTVLISFITSSLKLNPSSIIYSIRFSPTAITVPLYGRSKPITSFTQFIELPVSIPAQEPQVGHAFCSISKNSSLLIDPSLNAPTASNIEDRFNAFPVEDKPAFIGPPEQKIAGTFVQTDASNIPGVILSQFGM